MVFAPVPLLTATIECPGATDELHLHAGGQGVWNARMVATLGVPVTLCAALGGETGDVLHHLLADEGLTLRSVEREASSGWYVHDRRTGQRTEVAASHGPALTRHELDELYGLALAEGLRANVSILSGTPDPALVAPEAYRRLAADLTGNGARVVADLTGEHLTAVLAGGVSLVKVSHEELRAAGRVGSADRAELVDALHALAAEGAAAVIISRAAEPALALLDGAAYEIALPSLEVAEHRGAGDSMTAAAAARLARGADLVDAVRTGAAAGAVNVTRHGLGTGHTDLIAEIADRVEMRRL
ncbi:1-phosphofructokinase [Pilimelia anulata]|uniref:1-phosphofructokinase n=2 Tax=Pilimelia anulata TaxID=53371 RepID=A0A8J3FBN8_9ACTN|nr:1-phosphofructokinase [Pilimelia anulata]